MSPIALPPSINRVPPREATSGQAAQPTKHDKEDPDFAEIRKRLDDLTLMVGEGRNSKG